MRTDKDNRQSYEHKKAILAEQGITLELTYEQWLQVWMGSGKLEKMKGKDRSKGFVMTRIDRLLPYTADNVEIVTSRESEIRGRIRIGEKHRDSTKKKMSKAHTGKSHSEETKESIGLGRKGHKQSEETKQKISERMKAYHAEKKQQKKA